MSKKQEQRESEAMKPKFDSSTCDMCKNNGLPICINSNECHFEHYDEDEDTAND